MRGFKVLQTLSEVDIPEVIFATADDKSALRAVKVNSLDYFLKPFKRERLKRSLAKKQT